MGSREDHRVRRQSAPGARLVAALGLALATGAAAPAEPTGPVAEPPFRHGISFLRPLRYGPAFEHFDYVNPDAPKGGRLRVPVMGTWDSFNNFIDKGRDAEGLSFTQHRNLLYDRLLERSIDEPMSFYGRLAEGVRAADDYAWVEFRLRPEARWHDGEPVTADDVIWSFRTYKAHGAAWLRTMLRDVERIERRGPRTVRYVMRETAIVNPNIPFSLGLMPVLPEHYWAGRDPSVTTVEPPLGSGPYRIGEFEVGRHVVFERVEDYWGRDLPVNKGRYNFDRIRFIYFRDEQVQLEAHKGHVVDVRQETVSKSWATEYDFPALRAGLFKREMLELTRPAGLWWPVFWNLRVERLRDVRVREALWLLYDFEWINRVLLFGFYDHGRSLFHGSEMAQRGLPSEAELELLEPWRGQIPERVFTSVYRPPDSDGYGRDRDRLERALELFREAGWIVRDGRMVHAETGERFRLEFVVVSSMLVRGLMPYLDALERVGIETTARAPEVSNWLYRMRSGDFDAGQFLYLPSRIPGLGLRARFSSEAAEQPYGLNWTHVKHPAVDALIDTVITARTERRFLAATRALDRVLLWNFYFVPGMAQPGYRLVYWDKFGRPEHAPLERWAWYDIWWWDERKAARVRRGLAELGEGDG